MQGMDNWKKVKIPVFHCNILSNMIEYSVMKLYTITKRIIASFLIASLVFSFLFFAHQSVYASNFADENLDITFQFPENATIIPVKNQKNFKSFTTTDASAINIYTSDLYYEVTNNGDEKLVKKYPEDSVWIGCGLFEDTWNNQDYVYNYLFNALNKSSTQYAANLERIELQGLTYYKFSYYEELGNAEKPGGVIYLTLYRAKLYEVDFNNASMFSSAANYGNYFESTVQMNGIDQYKFPVFKNFESYYIGGSASALLVLAAIAFIIIKRKKKRI